MPHLMFVACAADNTIHTIACDDAGALRPVAVTAIEGASAGATSLPLALSPDRTRLYAALRNEPCALVSFAIDADGVLTQLAMAPLPHSMAYICTDPAGRQIFGASYPGGLVSRTALDADGGARAEAVQILETPPRAHCILPGPIATSDGAPQFYVPCLGGDTILRLRLDADAGLVEVGRTAVRAGAGPRHIVFSPDARHAYSLNELDATIDVWQLDGAGGLHPRQSMRTLPDGTEGRIAAADIHLTDDGAVLVASERLTHRLTSWARDPATGLIAQICSADTEATPRGFAILPGGRHLVAAGQDSGHVRVHEIARETGVLIPGARLAVGGNPNWISVLG